MAITIPILTDFNGSGIDRAVAQFQRLEGAGPKAAFLLRKAALPAAAALGAIGVGAKVAVDAAADMNETLSKSEVLFGDGAKVVAEWSKTTSSAFGISRQEALTAATNFATFGKAAGLTGTELTKFSTDFTGLAADLASFNNTSPQEAIEAIGSALRGEAEPMRKYGVLLDDASLRQEALRLGLISTTKEALTPQNKVLAAQALIYKQTKDAQGDFSRTSDSAANRQKILKARMDDLTASLGSALLPAFETLTGILVKVAGWFQENEGVAKVLITTVAGLSAAILIANGVMKASAVIMGTVRGAMLLLNLVLAANPVMLVVTAIGALVAGLVIAYRESETFRGVVENVFNWLKKLWDFLSPIGSAAFDGLKMAFNAINTPMNTAWDLFKKLADAGKPIINFLKEVVGGAFNGLKSALNLIDTPLDIVGKAFGTIKDAAEWVIDKLKGVGRGAFAAAAAAFRALTIPVQALAAALRAAKDLWQWFKSQVEGEGGNPFAPGGSLAGPVGNMPGRRSAMAFDVPAGVGTVTAGGAPTYIINVEAGLVSTPDQVGQQIIEAIQRAQRRSGPAFVAA
jgi:hypothetical protein